MAEPAVTASLAYRDPIAAIKWLQNAFGFEIAALLIDKEGKVGHAAVSHGDAEIDIMPEWSSPALLGPTQVKSPASTGSTITAFLRLTVADVKAHCEHARAAGATITQEPTDQFYGDRTYRAIDPEGHVWNFRQKIFETPSDFSGMGLVNRTDDLK